MKISRSEILGFCHGVRRAVLAAENNPNSFIVGGDIIHNPSEAARLCKDYNVISAPDPASIPINGKALIRAHGVSQKIEDDLRNRNVSITDATCPNVKKVHELTQSLVAGGYTIFLLGDRDHPEVLGIVGRVDREVIIFSSLAELESINIPTRVALISQTTKPLDEFEKAKLFISARAEDFESFCTVCPAMCRNIDAAANLASKCDVMIIVGGAKSSNTKALVQTAKQFCKDCYSVEDASQLKREWFDGKKHCGIAAGLSTPDYSVDQVEHTIVTFS